MFELPELKFTPADVKEFMSEDTINFHYNKHFKGYAQKAANLIKGTPYESLEIPLIITDSYKKDKAIFNNVAQFYNHELFFKIINFELENKMSPEFKAKIEASFKSFEAFKEEFCDLATAQFGSGWVWLVKKRDGSLDLCKSSNAKNPLLIDMVPIMTCDVWEHAYYLDYQNRRADFVKDFLENLVNWSVVEERYDLIDIL